MGKLAELWIKLKSFLQECKRVLLLTKKPTKDEFKIIVKVTAAGMLIIGLIGFLISMAGKLITW